MKPWGWYTLIWLIEWAKGFFLWDCDSAAKFCNADFVNTNGGEARIRDIFLCRVILGEVAIYFFGFVSMVCTFVTAIEKDGS